MPLMSVPHIYDTEGNDLARYLYLVEKIQQAKHQLFKPMQLHTDVAYVLSFVYIWAASCFTGFLQATISV